MGNERGEGNKMEAAKVTRIITKQGAEGLRDAIAYGMMDADIERMAHEVIEENNNLRKSNLELCAKLREAQEEVRKMTEQYTSEHNARKMLMKAMTRGYQAAMEEQSKINWHKAWRITGLIVAACVGAVLMMLSQTIVLFR